MSKDKSRRDSNGPVQPENANEFPGGSINTAGGQTRNANVLDALKSVRLTDFKEVHRKPCVRDALLPGIGAGFVMGGIRAIMGGMLNIVPLPMKSDGNRSNLHRMYLGSG